MMKMKIIFLDKHGWPVTMTRGRAIQNALRLILHTRKIRFGGFAPTVAASGSMTDTAGHVVIKQNAKLPDAERSE